MSISSELVAAKTTTPFYGFIAFWRYGYEELQNKEHLLPQPLSFLSFVAKKNFIHVAKLYSFTCEKCSKKGEFNPINILPLAMARKIGLYAEASQNESSQLSVSS